MAHQPAHAAPSPDAGAAPARDLAREWAAARVASRRRWAKATAAAAARPATPTPPLPGEADRDRR